MTVIIERPDPAEASRQVTTIARGDFLNGQHRAVVVDSPPGAGKSTFVVATAVAAVNQYGQIPIVAQTNAQADDLCNSLHAKHPTLQIGRLTGGTPTTLTNTVRMSISRHLDKLEHCDIVVATAAKWAYSNTAAAGMYPVGIVDEAYQMRSDQLLYVSPIFDRALFVGDPGQLDPFTPIDDSDWQNNPTGPVHPAVATVLHNHPDTPVHKLPVSWRLNARCAPLVSDAFYPTMPFQAGTDHTQRDMRIADLTAHPALHTAAEHGWALIELPHQLAPVDDPDIIATIVELATQLVSSRTLITDTGHRQHLNADRIAIGVVHRSQRAAIRAALNQHLDWLPELADITVDTANRLQGREYDVVLVWHPLSGRATASDFHLETGRLCVLLSRHRHACIIVTRAGIQDVLDTHPETSPIWLGADRLDTPNGWEANQAVLDLLDPYRHSR